MPRLPLPGGYRIRHPRRLLPPDRGGAGHPAIQVDNGDNIHPRNDNIAPCSLPVVFMYESPKWLLATGRLDQCRAALTGIMRLNKVQANYTNYNLLIHVFRLSARL